jgi:hypothetical protein
MRFRANTAIPAPSADTIWRWEKRHHVKLPADYLAVLREGNGAIPIDNCFRQGPAERVIERMLCIAEGKPADDPLHGQYDIGAVIAQVGDRLFDDLELVGANVVPIASLSAGDLLCLDFRFDEDAPEVVVWDHGRSEELRPHFEKVADSFAALLAMLHAAGGSPQVD